MEFAAGWNSDPLLGDNSHRGTQRETYEDAAHVVDWGYHPVMLHLLIEKLCGRIAGLTLRPVSLERFSVRQAVALYCQVSLPSLARPSDSESSPEPQILKGRSEVTRGLEPYRDQKRASRLPLSAALGLESGK